MSSFYNNLLQCVWFLNHVREFTWYWYVYRKSNAGIPGVWVYKLGYGAAIEEPNPDIIAEEPGK